MKLDIDVCCVKTVFFSLILCLIIMLYFCWNLIFPPPIPEFQLTSLSLANSHVSVLHQNMTATWDARFQIHNPSKISNLSYKHIFARISFKSDELAKAQIFQLHRQDRRNTTVVDVRFSLDDSYIGSRVAHDVNKELARSKLGFNVTVEAKFRYSFNVFWLQDWSFMVSCNDAVVELSGSGESGSLIGGAKLCKTEVFYVETGSF